MTGTLKTNNIVSFDSDSDLSITGNGTGKPDIEVGFKVGGSSPTSGQVLTDTGWAAPADSGGPSLGTDHILRTNASVISEDITIPSGTNASTVGPITVTSGFTVTVNGNWVVV